MTNLWPYCWIKNDINRTHTTPFILWERRWMGLNLIVLKTKNGLKTGLMTGLLFGGGGDYRLNRLTVRWHEVPPPHPEADGAPVWTLMWKFTVLVLFLYILSPYGEQEMKKVVPSESRILETSFHSVWTWNPETSDGFLCLIKNINTSRVLIMSGRLNQISGNIPLFLCRKIH